MSAKTGAAAARKDLDAALTQLETALARRAAPAAEEDEAGLTARVAQLEAALARAERDRDTARAALGALRAARAEDARLLEDALQDLRTAV